MNKKNSTGDNIKAGNANWKFDETVSKNFDTHVSKSIPLYEVGHDLVLKISDFFLNDQSICYDLGCATGSLLKKLSNHTTGKKIKYIGIDNSEEMIKQCENNIDEDSSQQSLKDLQFIHSDLMDVTLEKSDLIIAYYTSQFVKPKNRQILFDRIFEALNWGGAFLLFEKVRGPDARFQDMMTSIYTDYKIDQGYNSEEIIGKARSLKGVLNPFSTQANIDLLKRAGFIDIMTVMKYVCFEGFLAIK